MDIQGNKKAAGGFASAFAASFAASLSGAIRSTATIKVLENPDLGTRQGPPVHFRLTVEGGVNGECFVGFYEAQVAELGSMILGRPGEALRDEHVEALEKAINSAMAGLAASLVPEYGELSFKIDRVPDLAFGGMLLVPLALMVKEQSAMPLLMYFDGPIQAALSSRPGMKQAADAMKATMDGANLKLVMDVELNVSLRFGQRQLPLREVLDLSNGSVVELDRQVDEPVELLLDGKVIARGEAVIVDGHYGLRVTEVPQPMVSHFIN